MEKPLGSWTNKELIAELNRVGAKTSGRKSLLIERLESYRRNANFVGPTISIPEPSEMPPFPESGFFRSLTTEDWSRFPPIRREHVEQYCIYRQAADKSSSSDNRAVLRGETMVKGNTVDAISFYVQDDLIYLTGITNAEMKQLGYSYKVILNEFGEVQNSNCECPVGKGPHCTCKHITAVLLVLVEFKNSKVLTVNESCTETLQTFQRPKKYHKGSPVKAENLGRGVREDDDPRKPEHRKRPSYNDEVRNLTTNFVFSTGIDISMRYTVAKANLFEAAIDHQYLEIPFTQF